MGNELHLAVALEGDGVTPDYWVDLVREAERGLLDLVTLDGSLDPVLVASRVAPLTSRIGLVPAVVATHTEPFHVSKAIATLDYVSQGRAGVWVRVSEDPAEARLFGRREISAETRDGLVAEAGDHVEVLRRLWDSWEDDAEIRDVATGRFVDRDKLHYIDFEGRYFSVKGPSITPRPPQGQPLVAASSGEAGGVDLVFTTSPDEAARSPHHFVDHVVSGRSAPGEVADLVAEWHAAGVRGVRLRPERLPDDLSLIVSDVVPLLQERGVFRTEYTATTLRGHLGLPRPANRYAA
ncbi:LLM class flavin-dependent oxidoreductase [Saccharothrix syringae]|uniref:LLM class flavin-dependent oxidoreductase n=1 Tax=Saccharothrix syringae TaxID=103733 RepID=A0A5Q0HB63_SACSY|nr:LLM class flavin-dependent oxidoreductase [Saccharothrix syringae]QFZ23050.1 LLM class flavin-dependent oxidoreductase [Saccharothrix syringae]